MQLPRKSEHHKPGSDKEVPPMTIPWMQNDDFGSVDGRVEDHRCKIDGAIPFRLLYLLR